MDVIHALGAHMQQVEQIRIMCPCAVVRC